MWKKDDKLICEKCQDHIATFAHDASAGTPINELLFKEDEGQGPWKYLDRMACRNCGASFYDTLRFRK